jgi:hypothetical protein
MNIFFRVVVVLVIVFFGVLVLHNATRPRPYKWTPSFRSIDKNPYGASVLFNRLKDLFPDKEIKQMGYYDLQPYYAEYDYRDYTGGGTAQFDSLLGEWVTNLLDKELYFVDEDRIQHFNFFGLNNYFEISDQDAYAFRQHIYQGNHALISSYDLSPGLIRPLGIKLLVKNESNWVPIGEDDYSVSFRGGEFRQYKPFDSFTYISSYPEGAEVIARTATGKVVGVKIPIGKGSITYFSLPIVFSNYYLLKVSPDLAERLLLELPVEDTRWANMYHGAGYTPPNRSLLSFIHSDPALTWAFYLLLFSLIIFFAFQVKRSQRAIPEIFPPENVSLKFSEMLSKLYLLRGDYRDMVRKKMNYFLEHLRTHLLMDTSEINEVFYERLSSKTNVEEHRVKELFTVYFALRSKSQVTEDEFIRFNTLIQHFKKEL